jgi:hypothetical protein
MTPQLPKLNFPLSKFKLKEDKNKFYIYDVVRRKFVVLTPEEWVRQNCLHYLRDYKHYPMSLLAVEKGIIINNQNLRYDIVAYNKKTNPVLLVECKAPEVKISQSTFDQIAAYNLALKVPYLLLTNGLQHYCCASDFENSRYNFLKEVPDFKEL